MLASLQISVKGMVRPHFQHQIAETYTLKNPTPSVSGLLSYEVSRKNVLKHDIFLTYHSHDNSSRPSFGPILISDFLRISQDARNIRILSSCNGLLLLSCLFFSEENLNNASKNVYYLVCNPTTKLISAPLLAPLEPKSAGRYLEAMAFAFDPAGESSVHYKLVCVRVHKSNFAIKIYSSETGSWRSCPGTWALPHGVTFIGGIYWKGNMHYINVFDGHDSVYFSLRQDQTLKSLSMPLLRDRNEFGHQPVLRNWRWGQSGGHLWLVENRKNLIIDVYNLKTDYSAWEMLYQIHLSEIESVVMEVAPGIITSKPSLIKGQALSVVVRNDNDEQVFEIMYWLPGALVAYNPKSHTSRLLWEFKRPYRALYELCYKVEDWCETLAPV